MFMPLVRQVVMAIRWQQLHDSQASMQHAVFMAWGPIKDNSWVRNQQKKKRKASAAKAREAPAKPELSEYLVQPSASGPKRRKETKKIK